MFKAHAKLKKTFSHVVIQAYTQIIKNKYFNSVSI